MCHRCARELTAGEGSFYVVRLEAFADPTPPRVDPHEPLPDITAEIDALIERAGNLSEQRINLGGGRR